MILADGIPPIPISQTTYVLVGLFGIMGFMLLTLSLVEKFQSVFGRKESFALRGETDKRFETLIAEMRESFAVMASQRQRANDELHHRVTELGKDVSFIRGSLDSTRNKS